MTGRIGHRITFRVICYGDRLSVANFSRYGVPDHRIQLGVSYGPPLTFVPPGPLLQRLLILSPVIVTATNESISRAVELLAAGQLVGMPTETVYGLAANAWDPHAVRRIYQAKSRPITNPLIIHVASVDRLSDAIQWPPDPQVHTQLESLLDLWPGPLTVVCDKASRVPAEVTAGQSSVAVRVPAHPVALQLLQACRFPLAAPSANRSQYISPTRPEHLLGPSGIAEHLSLVLDGGPCRWGLESTIVRLGERPQLLRPGGIAVEELAARLGVTAQSLLSPSDTSPAIAGGLGGHDDSPPGTTDTEDQALLAPGMMREHYCPSTPLKLLPAPSQTPLSTAEQQSMFPVGTRAGRIAFRPLSNDEAQRFSAVITLSQSGDLMEIARGLFAALRSLDSQQLDLICCDTCETNGLGRAIMDRLQRAAARYE